MAVDYKVMRAGRMVPQLEILRCLPFTMPPFFGSLSFLVGFLATWNLKDHG